MFGSEAGCMKMDSLGVKPGKGEGATSNKFDASILLTMDGLCKSNCCIHYLDVQCADVHLST